MGEFFQQTVNGLALGSIYALIALGYTLVYGVLRFINFAHGDVLMIGAYAAFYVTPPVQRIFGAGPSVATFLGVLLISMLACAALGIAIERLAYRPLRNHARLTVLITSIGVSMLLSYGGQVVFGVRQQPFPELLAERHVELGGGVGIASGHMVVIGVTLLLLTALHLVVHHTRYGLAIRALAQNATAAELMGVNLNATIAWAFGLGSALAGGRGGALCDEHPFHRTPDGDASGNQGVYRRRHGRNWKPAGSGRRGIDSRADRIVRGGIGNFQLSRRHCVCRPGPHSFVSTRGTVWEIAA